MGRGNRVERLRKDVRQLRIDCDDRANIGLEDIVSNDMIWYVNGYIILVIVYRIVVFSNMNNPYYKRDIFDNLYEGSETFFSCLFFPVHILFMLYELF